MPNFASFQSVYLLLSLTAPAVVFLFFRSRFTHGRMPKASDAILYFIAITSIYYSLIFPIFMIGFQTPKSKDFIWVTWILVLIILPAILGVFSGWVARKEFVYKALRKIGFDVVHDIPTAWEWKFSNVGPSWVVITLKNGNSFGAEYGSTSFISTDPSDRDIYLEETYSISKTGKWTKRGYGMWVASSEISTLEFSTQAKV